jgi:hypothetical protein
MAAGGGVRTLLEFGVERLDYLILLLELLTQPRERKRDCLSHPDLYSFSTRCTLLFKSLGSLRNVLVFESTFFVH